MSARIDFRRVTQIEVAEFFEITPRQVRKWTRWGCPRNRDESYDLRKVVTWRCKFLSCMKTKTWR